MIPERDDYALVVCSECEQSWVLDEYSRPFKSTVQCPHCETAHDTRLVDKIASGDCIEDLRDQRRERKNSDIQNQLLDEKSGESCVRGLEQTEKGDSKSDQSSGLGGEDSSIARGTTGSLSFKQPNEVEADITGVETATGLHQGIFDARWGIRVELFEAISELTTQANGSVSELWRLLDAGVDETASRAASGVFDTIIRQFVSGRVEPQVLIKLTKQLGGSTSIGERTGFSDVYQGPLKIFRMVEITPQITIELSNGVVDKDTQTLDTIIEYITELKRGCDVTIATSRVNQVILINNYESELPPNVIESVNPRWETGRIIENPQERARQLVATEIDADDTAVDVLQMIAEGRTDTAEYGVNSKLVNDVRLPVGRARISQIVNELEDLRVVDTFKEKNKLARVTNVGKEVLELLRREKGYQSTFERVCGSAASSDVSQTLNPDADTCNHAQGRLGGRTPTDSTTEPLSQSRGSPKDEVDHCLQPDHSRNHSDGFAEREYLTQYEHHAAFAAADEGQITLDNVGYGSENRSGSLPFTLIESDDNRVAFTSYNEDRKEVIAGAEYHSPLTLGVGMARAITDPLLTEKISPNRLDKNGTELGNILEGQKTILRDHCCMGWLKDEYDGDGYVGALRAGMNSLLDMTRKLNDMRRDSDTTKGDISDLCRDILQHSHGLIGTATAIYDYLGIDLHRTIRIPGSIQQNLDHGSPGDSHRTATVESLCHWVLRASTIASKLDTYRQSRIQFEDREEKRNVIDNSLSVPRSDPTGSHIGSWSIVGHGADTLRDDLKHAFENPDVYNLPAQTEEDDYVGWVVDMEIKTGFDRLTAHRVARRMLTERNLKPTRHGVSLLHAFCDSPHDAAYALYHLSSEDGRRVRVDEIRFALTHLPPKRILPSGSSSTKSKILHTLLAAEKPLPQTKLCERAGVSTASFAGHGDHQSHRDELSAFGLIHKTTAGWVIALPYDTDVNLDVDEADENQPVTGLPWYAIVEDDANYTDRKRPSKTREESLQGVLYEVIISLEDDIGNAEPPLEDILYGSLSQDDLSQLAEYRPQWRPLIQFVTALREGDPVAIGTPETDRPPVDIRTEASTATLGRPPDQALIDDYPTGLTANSTG